MTSITFYGGVNEVGGNKVLVKDEDAKVFLDFGTSFTKKRNFYQEPLMKPKMFKELFKFNLLPEIEGLYFFSTSQPEIDGVFISHGHRDHSGYISFLKREIPVFCGETTKEILEGVFETQPRSYENNISGLKFKTFRTGDKIKIGSLTIEPVHCDHSIPGAYGFIIYTSSGSIVYTGDFRMHGKKPELTQDFVEKAEKAEPVALITEATNLTSGKVMSEKELKEKLKKSVKKTKELVLVNFALTDTDRLNSFYNVAEETGRKLVVTTKQAYLLKKLEKDKRLNLPKLRELTVFSREKKRVYRWEKEIIEQTETIDSASLAKKQNKYITILPFYSFQELFTIKPELGSVFIHSSSEPFNEEQEVEYEKLENWLIAFGLPQYHLHVSGHIMPLELREVIERIKPKKVFPIHTEHPELFKKFMKDLKGEIEIVEHGKEYTLDKI